MYKIGDDLVSSVKLGDVISVDCSKLVVHHFDVTKTNKRIMVYFADGTWVFLKRYRKDILMWY